MHVFTSSPVDYHTKVHDFGRQHKCDDTMFKFREGTRHSGVRGLEKQILVRIFYISRSYCLLLVGYASVQVWKQATVFARGLGPPMAGASRERRDFVSCILYVTARYYLDLPQFGYGKHASVFARRLGPPRPRAGRSECESEFLVSCVLYVAGRY